MQDLIVVVFGWVKARLAWSEAHSPGWRCCVVGWCGLLHEPSSSNSAVLYIVPLLHPSPLSVVGKYVRQKHFSSSPSLCTGVTSVFQIPSSLPSVHMLAFATGNLVQSSLTAVFTLIRDCLSLRPDLKTACTPMQLLTSSCWFSSQAASSDGP